MDVGTNREVVDAAFKEQERGRLTYIINQWNAKRLDLFEVTQPDQVRILFWFLLLANDLNVFFDPRQS